MAGAMKLAQVVFLLAMPASLAVVRVGSRASASEKAMMSLVSMEAEEASFWTSEYTALEKQIVKLASIAGNGSSNSTLAASNGSQVKLVAANASAAKPKHHHEKPLIPKNMNLNPKTPADLLPALAMLKSLYEDGKERIGKLNVREKEMKTKFDKKEADHKAKLEDIEARYKAHKLNDEFHTNETRDENRFWAYWQKVRNGQHRQYHTGLKLQHATLDKVKKMIDMYEKTLAGKTTEAKQELERVAPPEIVFLQESVVHFCRDALVELREARVDLRRGNGVMPLEPPLV